MNALAQTLNKMVRHPDYVDNLASLSREMKAEVFRLTVERASEHGMPPADRHIAAAHEAGHIIAAASAGYCADFRKATIFNAGPMAGWLGSFMPADEALALVNKALLEDHDPVMLLRKTAMHLGGASGEWMIDSLHPTSSLEEILHANLDAATAFAIHFGAPLIATPEGFKIVDFDGYRADRVSMKAALGIVNLGLKANRESFDILRKELAKRERLGRGDLARLTKNVQKLPESLFEEVLANATRVTESEAAA